jgi:hypothetical protein
MQYIRNLQFRQKSLSESTSKEWQTLSWT